MIVCNNFVMISLLIDCLGLFDSNLYACAYKLIGFQFVYFGSFVLFCGRGSWL